MNTTPTETYPYTLPRLSELLGVDEARILALCEKAGIRPQQEQSTGSLFFGLQDVETLRKLVNTPATDLTTTRQPYSSVPQRVTGGSSGLTRADLSSIVESVSNAKEEILRDLSHLLDDKLSGLDEVVVELIRSKSENDTLREELKRLEERHGAMQAELSKFKPAAFGFYRKES